MNVNAKAWVMVLMTILAAVIPGFANGWNLDFVGWVNVGVLAAGAIMVYNAANLPGYPVAKLIAAAVAAVGVALLSGLSDGSFSATDAIQCVLALGGAVGVYSVRNAPEGRHEAV